MNAPEKLLTEIPWPNPIDIQIDFKRKHLISPERARIDCGSNDQGKRFKAPIGVICFRQRRLGAKGNRHSWSVNPETLVEERRAVVSKFIDWLSLNYSNASARTIETKVTYFRAVFDWIDKDYIGSGSKNVNFECLENLKDMYLAYTKHLKHMVLLGQTGNPNNGLIGITNNSAKYNQAAARNLVMICLGLDEETVKSWAETFTKKARPYSASKASEVESIERFHNHIVKVIEDHYQIHVLKNQSVIDSEQWGWLTGTRKDFDKRGLSTTGIESQLNALTLVGFYFMVLATGQNESVLLSLKANEIELNRWNKTTFRVGIKRRAKSKEIIIEMGTEHKPIFERYLAIRNAIAPSEKTFLFPDYVAKSNKAVPTHRKFSKLWKSALGGKVFRAQVLRRFYARKIGQIAQSMGSQSGELNGIIALMLQNKPRTSCQYSIESLEQAAEPLSQFLSELHDACIEKSRTYQTIQVQFKANRDTDRSTPTGACENDEGQTPQLAKGFSDSVVRPSCGRWETCLFCEHYSVHADDIDLKKLLSLKAVIHLLHQGMDEGDYTSRFTPLLARIQEVIDAILITNPSLKNRFKTVNDDCEAGDLDDFWAVYMRTLRLNGYRLGGAL